MTYHELVEKVQTALAKADASKVENHIAVQVDVTGEAAGAFYMQISDGVLYIAPYDYKDRDALLTADGADVLSVAEGKISLENAIKEGKIAHEGNWEKTLELSAVIPVKKRGRKAAAKVEEVKEKAEAKVEEVKEKAEAKVEEVKEKAEAKVEEIKEKAETKVEEVKETAKAKRKKAASDKPAKTTVTKSATKASKSVGAKKTTSKKNTSKK